MVTNDIATSQANGGHFCGICTGDDDMIGIVDYVPSHFEGDPHAAFLSLLMIAAPFRQRGIGHAVIDVIEAEIMNDAQIHAIHSGVQVNNPHAVRFWENQGYRIVSGPDLLPDQTTVFGLQKDVFLD